MLVHPVILCGGSGTRLWPLSRKSYPKQFSDLVGERTLFQETALRMQSSDECTFAPLSVVTASEFRFIVSQQLQNVGLTPGSVIIEPCPRNTAPAILAAALRVLAEDSNAVLLVTPSDHIIPDTKAFHQVATLGLKAVQSGKMVTFGIKPTRPETGYGYLEVAGATDADFVSLKRFVEKPNLEVATEMVSAGNFYWNAGIFLFRASDMVAAFETFEPRTLELVRAAIADGKSDLDFFRLDSEHFKKCDNISIDYAIMEKADNLALVPFVGKWSDLGDWDAVWAEMGPDERGVSLSEQATAIDCESSLLRSERAGQQIVGIGLKDIIAVAMPDAVLVAHKSRAQDVKKAVEALRAKGLAQAESFPKDHRPWGWFETLAISERFQVKRIHVHPGAALSLQSHHHRSEHWVVVTGTAKVTVDDEVKLVGEGASVYIPLGAVHRMENPGKLPMVLIEVQTGPYLGEDDIVRYEDIYART